MTNPFKRRWFRVIAWFLMSVLTLIALLWLSINWAGARALRATEAKFKAAGESLDINKVLPGPVPDERNFCAIPILKDLALVVDGDADKGEPAAKRKRLKELAFWRDELPRIKAKDIPKSPGGDRSGRFSDMAAWSKCLITLRPDVTPSDNPARTVLNCLSVQDAAVAELAAGRDRPEARWTPDWQTRMSGKPPYEMTSPHVIPIMSMSKALALRATAAARCGEVGKAHEAIRILAKISKASGNEQVLGLLVASAVANLIAATARELCDAQAGGADDFRRLEELFSSMDLRGNALQAWRGETASLMSAWGQVRRGRYELLFPSGDDIPATMRLIPGGIYDGGSAAMGETLLETIILPLRDRGWTASLDAMEVYQSSDAGSAGAWQTCRHPFQAMSRRMVSSGLIGMLAKAGYTQCLIDQCVIACVLEQHRIEKGGYPETLEGLALSSGKPLPIDIVSGKPMGYRRTPDGKYMLWSVGLDRMDDGGKRIDARFNATETSAKGDWVWSFSPEK